MGSESLRTCCTGGGRQRSGSIEPGYVSYVLALLFTEFLDDKSRLYNLSINGKSQFIEKLISEAVLN